MAAEPASSALSNQPTKLYPALFGADGALAICSAVLVVVEETAEPRFESNVTLSVLADQIAYRVKPSVSAGA